MNTEYDIEKAFATIEDELISSMMRNLSRHRASENEKGYNWTQWQAEQLKYLEKYKQDNKDKFSSQFSNINNSIDEMISTARSEGGTEQEQKILEAIKNGFKSADNAQKGVTADFFRLNTRKLEALQKATKGDFKTAEKAMLRMANDKYRQIIYNAQVYANTGAGTYEKAVDMATKDFLSAGINCIEYKNGSRHNIKDYAKMAIRTANKRAYLTGEGEQRKKWGISTVIMNKRGNACPKCLPFVGKVLIDDVWSGGKASDGPYPLMSKAIQAGLYHPNCKDSHTTYFADLDDDEISPTYTKKELSQIEDDYRQEQKQQYANRMVEKFDRLAKYSLDPDNKKLYANRRNEWNETVDYMSNSFRPHYGKEDIIKLDNLRIKVRSVNNSLFKMFTDTENPKNKAVRLTEKNFKEVKKQLPENFEIPQIVVVDFERNRINPKAIGGFHNASQTLFINSKYNTKEKILKFVNNEEGGFANNTEYAPYLHELGHKYYYDAIKVIEKNRNISYSEANKILDRAIYNLVQEIYQSGDDIKEVLSQYAYDGYERQKFTEIIAESFSAQNENIIAKKFINVVEMEVNRNETIN